MDNDAGKFDFKTPHSADICKYVFTRVVDRHINNGSHFCLLCSLNKDCDNVDFCLLFFKLFDVSNDSNFSAFTLLLAMW
jgi:hypothetical protein